MDTTPTAATQSAAKLRSGAQIPTSTYRVQLSRDFTFRDAERIVPYLARLGVGSLYASPIFKATPGSTHGYDVTDYQQLNPELGDDADFAALAATLDAHGVGLVIDFVPNHMGIGSGRNDWWQDVLESGPVSPFTAFFDIDWRPLKRELRDKVLLPILGDQYGAVLERGELELRLQDGAFHVQYFEHPLPIAPPTYPMILRYPLDALVEALPTDDDDILEYQSIITALERLPGPEEEDPDALEERQREQVVAKRRLATLVAGSVPIAGAVGEALREFNGRVGDPDSFDLLDNLLANQSYRLAYWRVAGEEINYRRFFAINELAAIRQEVPAVFAHSHELLLRLLADGLANGVRIDHPDGLWDPARYFQQLQRAYQAATSGDTGLADEEGPPLYLVVEKILEHDESLPSDWAVHGTVGYEFATSVSGLFVDSANRRAFDELYGSFIGGRLRLSDVIYESKYLMMRTALVSEVNVLSQALNRISEDDRHTRDFTLLSLRNAIRETIANFPVYRTYIGGDGIIRDQDRRSVETAIAQAKRRNPALDRSVLDFLRDVLLTPPAAETATDGRSRFGMKFQQLTGPVMAKGLEDTAFYRYNRLVSLNEVGGNPAQFGTPTTAFHRENGQRQRRWPHGMLTTSTHDTKRSEDVRARINVLSEMPAAWRAAINRWTRLNRRSKRRLEGRPAPDRNDEYLLYQTLLGTWPAAAGTNPDPEYVSRITAYMEKALREAQLHTSWLAPNEEYEAATREFVEAVLDPAKSEPFLNDLASFQQAVAYFGAFNALSQQVLKLTAPGVPDIYQGAELWDLSLVDPDNRRPIDYNARIGALAELITATDRARLALDLVERIDNGWIKLYVTHRLLAFRHDHPDLFAAGDYLPVEVRGEKSEHVCAFRRRADALGEEVIIAVPRLIAGLLDGNPAPPVGIDVWRDTRLVLPAGEHGHDYRNLFTDAMLAIKPTETGAELPIAVVLADFPVAVLAPVPDQDEDGVS